MAERQRRTPDDPSGPVVLRPLVDFLHTEAAGGVVLLAATVVALAWANSPLQGLLHRAVAHPSSPSTSDSHTLDLDLQEWVNDGLMAHLLLRRRPGDQAGARRGRAARAAAGRAAGHRRGRRHGACRPLIYMAINAGGDGRGRLGHPDGHRHRDGRRRAEPARPAGRPVAQAVPARPRHRRRHRRDPRHRRLLLRRHRPRRAGAGRSRSCSSSGSCCAGRRAADRRCTSLLGVAPVAGHPRVGHPRHARRRDPRPDGADAADPPAPS